MKKALYFGSFNPIHNYHIAIANHLLEHEGFDCVDFVLSPQNPLKKELASYSERRMMLQKALFYYPNMVINDIETSLPKPSYTIDTLNLLKRTMPDVELVIVMGMDNWYDIKKWKDYKLIVENYEILVIPRIVENSYVMFGELLDTLDCKIHPETRVILGMPLYEISSTFIREEVKNGNSVYPYMDRAACSWMLNEKLYNK